MNGKEYLIYILPKTLGYRASRYGLLKPGNPITLTYSVTAARQSKCKTCNIGLKYQQDPKRKNKDLSPALYPQICISIDINWLRILGNNAMLVSLYIKTSTYVRTHHMRPLFLRSICACMSFNTIFWVF